jgi:hypothetical protein
MGTLDTSTSNNYLSKKLDLVEQMERRWHNTLFNLPGGGALIYSLTHKQFEFQSKMISTLFLSQEETSNHPERLEGNSPVDEMSSRVDEKVRKNYNNLILRAY